MIETKDNEICYSGLDNIYFYDSIQRKKNKMITNIDFNIYNLQGFVMISKELLFIPGVNKISIININEYNIIRIITLPNLNIIVGACLLNENLLLTGDNKGILKKWKIVGNNLFLISQNSNIHKDKKIFYLINIGEVNIVSFYEYNIIKIW